MHAYRDQYAQIFKDGQNVVLIAISADPIDTLAAWARDDQFQFLMASDTGGAVAKQYGALAGRPNIPPPHRLEVQVVPGRAGQGAVLAVAGDLAYTELG